MAHDRPLKRLNGLTALESRFVALRAADPIPPDYIIARQAGYKGPPKGLRTQAERLLARPQILAAIKGLKGNPAVTKANIQERLNAILHNDNAPFQAQIQAGRVLLGTIPQGFVPLQVDHSGKITMEDIVKLMGGDPQALPKELGPAGPIEAEITDRLTEDPGPSEGELQ